MCEGERERETETETETEKGGERRNRKGQKERVWNIKTDKDKQRREFSKQRKEVKDNEDKFRGKGIWRRLSRCDVRWTQLIGKSEKQRLKERRVGRDDGVSKRGPFYQPLTAGCCVTFTSQWKLPSSFPNCNFFFVKSQLQWQHQKFFN